MDNCNTVLTIPQFTGTCWFNALLMTLFYSDGMRKYLTNNLINSELYAKNKELYLIFLDILKNKHRNINNNDSIFLAELKPENILKILHQADKEKFYFDPDRFSGHWGENYFVRLFEYFGLKKKVLFLARNTLAKNSSNKYVYSKLNTNPKVTTTIRGRQKRFDVKFNYRGLTNQQKEKIRSDKNIDILVVTQFNYDARDNSNFIFETSSQDLEDIIVYNGSIYKIDSSLVHNFNYRSCFKSHQIAGVTCDNKRYMYNGWIRQTQDPAKQNVSTQYFGKSKPCELMKYDWFNNTSNFCLSYNACKIENRNAKHKEMCFNTTNIHETTYIYVKVEGDDRILKLMENKLKNVEKDCNKELSEMRKKIEGSDDDSINKNMGLLYKNRILNKLRQELSDKEVSCNKHIKEIKTRIDDIHNPKPSVIPFQKQSTLQSNNCIELSSEKFSELLNNLKRDFVGEYSVEKIVRDLKRINRKDACEIINNLNTEFKLLGETANDKKSLYYVTKKDAIFNDVIAKISLSLRNNCPKNRILNPKTGTCIKRSTAFGKHLEKEEKRDLKILEEVNKLKEYINKQSPHHGKCKELSISDIHKKIDSYNLYKGLSNDMKLLKNKEIVCKILNLIKESYSLQLILISQEEHKESKELLIEGADAIIQGVIQKEVDKALIEQNKKVEKVEIKKKCKENEILNPKTNRCVDRNGVTGKALLKEQNKKEDKVEVKKKTCKENEILNPKTNRCVDKNGVTGKAILKSNLCKAFN